MIVTTLFHTWMVQTGFWTRIMHRPVRQVTVTADETWGTPTVAIAASPRSAQEARRWVMTAFEDLRRDDLVETATLGVSELVANAVLHAKPPIALRVRGTAKHPRVEVADGSVHPPIPNPRPAEDDALLSTVGRGLTIVAMCSRTWGAYLEDDGKIVWFEPSAGFTDEPDLMGRIQPGHGYAYENPVTAENGHVIDLDPFPVSAFLDWNSHFRELHRELHLLSLSHETTYPAARTLNDLFRSLGDSLRSSAGMEQIEHLAAEGAESGPVQLVISRRAPEIIRQLIDAFELADAFCRSERLMSLATSPSQLAFQRWFFPEVIRQAAGEEPRPFSPGVPQVAGEDPGSIASGPPGV